MEGFEPRPSRRTHSTLLLKFVPKYGFHVIFIPHYFTNYHVGYGTLKLFMCCQQRKQYRSLIHEFLRPGGDKLMKGTG